MFKRIITGSLVVALIAVLVVGAINRTNARLGNEANHGAGPWAQTECGQDRGQGFGGQGRAAGESGPQSGPAQDRLQIIEWLTLEGKALSVRPDRLAITLADGKTVEMGGRAWSFAQQQGFRVQAGESVTVVGFYADDTAFVVGTLINKTSGQDVAVRDANGLPLWSGRGRNRT